MIFGPLDIFAQFNDLASNVEFKEKCFHPIIIIASENDLISKTFTLIAISEDPKIAEKPFAFVFTNTKAKNLETVRTQFFFIPRVLLADSVFDPFVVIYFLKLEDNSELKAII